jgi:hypothetical protein
MTRKPSCLLLHQDGSRHEWLAGQQHELIVIVDGATWEIYSAFPGYQAISLCPPARPADSWFSGPGSTSRDRPMDFADASLVALAVGQ